MARSRNDADYEDFLAWKSERDRNSRSRAPARPARRPTRRSRDDDDDDGGDDPVIVLAGTRADSFIERMFGSPAALDDDQADGDDDQADDDQADDDDQGDDDAPPDDPAPENRGHPYFRRGQGRAG
jgi:hypothetical protein